MFHLRKFDLFKCLIFIINHPVRPLFITILHGTQNNPRYFQPRVSQADYEQVCINDYCRIAESYITTECLPYGTLLACVVIVEIGNLCCYKVKQEVGGGDAKTSTRGFYA